MLSQQFWAKSSNLSRNDHSQNYIYFLKAGVFVISSIMLIAPFGLSFISESAIPLGLLLVYPLTIFACMRWMNNNNSKFRRVFDKTLSVLSFFLIYMLIEHIASTLQLFSFAFAFAFPALLALFGLFAFRLSSLSSDRANSLISA